MGGTECRELFDECQERGGKYRMFAFDIVDSQNVEPSEIINMASIAEDFAETIRTDFPESVPDPSPDPARPWDIDLSTHSLLSIGDAFAIAWENGPDAPGDDEVASRLEKGMSGKSSTAVRCGFADFDTLNWTDGTGELYAGDCFKMMTESFKYEVLDRRLAGE